MSERTSSPFNSIFETGIRSLTVLNEVFPETADLQRLVHFDYLVVHSGDAGGPKSLHAPLPLRTGELLVRRGLIERGIILMMSRKLVERTTSKQGFQFSATERTNPFLDGIASAYIQEMRERAKWVGRTFGTSSGENLEATIKGLFDQWTVEFQQTELPFSSST